MVGGGFPSPYRNLYDTDQPGLSSLLARANTDRWAGKVLTRGALPVVPNFNLLPAAGANYGYSLILVRGLPDTVYICLRDAAGTWGWRATVSGTSIITPNAPTTIALGDAASVGAVMLAAREDHRHGAPALSTATPTTIALADAAAVGSGPLSSRDDHRHGAPALSAATPVAEALGDTGVVGTGVPSSRQDHRHAMPALSVASPTTAAFGDAATVGTGIPSSRQDHRHGMMATPIGATAPTTQAFGDSPTTGAAATGARSDHLHGMPSQPAPVDATYLVTTANGTLTGEVVVGATPGGELGGSWGAPTVDATHSGSAHLALATNAIALGSAAAAGGAGTTLRSNDTIAAFDATAPVTQAFSDGAAVGTAAFAARRDHRHGMMAAPAADAPTDATYLVGASHVGLSAEIVVGATPGGELGGTWASPTVDATHSGSAHAAFATPAIVLGATAAAGAAATVIRSDATIDAFDTTAPVDQAFGDAAAVGSVAFAARRDHRHGMMADPGSLTQAYKYKTAAQSFVATTSYASVTATSGNLAFTPAASTGYEVVWEVLLSAVGAGGLKAQITGPGSPTAVQIITEAAVVGATADPVWGHQVAYTGAAAMPVTAFSSALLALPGTSLTVGLYRFRAFILNGSTATAVTLQMAQNTASGTTTIAAARMFVYELQSA